MASFVQINDKLALQFGISFQIVQSWFKRGFFSDHATGEQFFQTNIHIIKAKPFIKWVGGKRQLIKQFEKFYPKEYNNYFEPFLGGGAVFFNVQREKSFLSDVNEELINVYKVVKDQPYELIEFLESINHSKETFLEIRLWDRQQGGLKNYSPIQRAGRFIYLNRTCFNGLYRVNSKGEFNVPFGKYKNPDYIQKENLLNASQLLNQTNAEIKLQSFEKVLKQAQPGDFVYFDPPYDVLSDSSNFTSYDSSGFGRDMQKKLAQVFKKLDKKGVKLMLSNHNTPFIRELYKGFRFEIVKAKRNVNSRGDKRGEVEEIVVMNY